MTIKLVSGNTLKSLRKSIWSQKDAVTGRDVDESLRDLWGAINKLAAVAVLRVENHSYDASNILFLLKNKPAAILVSDLQVLSPAEDIYLAARAETEWRGQSSQLCIKSLAGIRMSDGTPSMLALGDVINMTALIVGAEVA